MRASDAQTSCSPSQQPPHRQHLLAPAPPPQAHRLTAGPQKRSVYCNDQPPSPPCGRVQHALSSLRGGPAGRGSACPTSTCRAQLKPQTRLFTMHAAATPARSQVQIHVTFVRCCAQPRSSGRQKIARKQQQSPAAAFSDKSTDGRPVCTAGCCDSTVTAEDEAVLSCCAGSRAQVDERSYASGHLWTLSSNAFGLRWPDAFASHCCGDQSYACVCKRVRGRTVGSSCCQLDSDDVAPVRRPSHSRTTNSAQRKRKPPTMNALCSQQLMLSCQWCAGGAVQGFPVATASRQQTSPRHGELRCLLDPDQRESRRPPTICGCQHTHIAAL